MPRAILIAVLLALSCASASNPAIADDTTTGCGGDAVKTADACKSVATAEKSAILQLPANSSNAAALEVTARPVAGANEPYLVGVFASDPSKSDAKLIGSFSFFPARVGEAQTFVLPTPASAPKDQTLSVKLIPANPDRGLKDAAVEILGARRIAQ